MSGEGSEGAQHLKQPEKEKELLEQLKEDSRPEESGEKTQNIINKSSKSSQISKKPAITGAIILLPVIMVGLVINWVFGLLEGIPGNQFLQFSSIYVINQTIKLGLILLGAAIITTSIGKIAKTSFGARIEKQMDKTFATIPIVGSIYKFTKVTAETVLDGGAEELSKPVKVEIDNMRLTAFKTGNKTQDGREIIFLPTSPNITTGFVIEVSSEDIIHTKETSKEALTRTLSAGFGQDNKKRR